MPEIMIEDYYSREQSGSDTEGDKSRAASFICFMRVLPSPPV